MNRIPAGGWRRDVDVLHAAGLRLDPGDLPREAHADVEVAALARQGVGSIGNAGPRVDRDPVRIVTGQAVNPVWSPDGSLIVYSRSIVTGQTALAWVRPDGGSVDLPPLRVRRGGYRFLPDGKGLVFHPTGPALDFWLLDFASKNTRQLTHLSDRGRIQTFDIAPDGSAIVFDRVRQNSDIVHRGYANWDPATLISPPPGSRALGDVEHGF